MATSKILFLSLIALSSFQVRNARVIGDDISDDFNKAVETLNNSLSKEVGIIVSIIGEIEERVLKVAVYGLVDFFEDIDRMEIQANSELQGLNVSETCKNKSAALLVELSSDIQNNISDCFDKHAEENTDTANQGRNVFLKEFMGYPNRLTQQFQECADDDCRELVLAEANGAIRQVKSEVWKAARKTFASQDKLMDKFREVCLTKSEQDYQLRTKAVIEEAEKCEDV